MQTALDIASRHAAAAGASRIARLTMRVGRLSGASPDALRFAFEVLSAGTAAEGTLAASRPCQISGAATASTPVVGEKAAALEKEQAAVQDRMAAEDRKLAAAEKAHEDATAPLLARLHEIRAAVSAAGDARRKLIDTCPYAALKAELAAVSDRLIELRGQAAALRERGELVKRAERDQETADRLQAGIVPFTSTARVDYWREQAERHRTAGKDALAALATVQKEIAKLEREEAAVFERMTKP